LDGHPIDIATCTAAEDEASETACGQQFANDSKVKVVSGGYFFAGGGAYNALAAAGKTVLGGEPLTPPDYSSPNYWAPRGGIPGVLSGVGLFATTFNPKVVADLNSNNPGGQAAVPFTEAPLKAKGVKVNLVYTNDNEPDMTGPMVAVGANKADVFLNLLATTGCIQVAKAAVSLGVKAPIITTSQCIDKTVQAAVSSEMNGWYFVQDFESNDVANPTNPDVLTLRAAWAKDGQGDVTANGAVFEFDNIMTLLRILKPLGYDGATLPAIAKAIPAFTGPVFGGAPTIHCPGKAPYTQICGQTYTAVQMKDGKFEAVNGGQFYPVPNT
jgi:branched-chain amino acid transport system substrate-binding protein